MMYSKTECNHLSMRIRDRIQTAVYRGVVAGRGKGGGVGEPEYHQPQQFGSNRFINLGGPHVVEVGIAAESTWIGSEFFCRHVHKKRF